MNGERALSPALRQWLATVAVSMFGLVGVGAWVRLEDAGLSMVRWEPVMGILPPIDEAAWASMYASYTHTPQYAVLRPSQDAFRLLFWPEYLHRVLGRLLFLGLAVPLAFPRVRAALGAMRARRLGHVIAGIAFQGTVGWLMVASGLRDRPMVHPWMLAFHLAVATALLLLLTAELDAVRSRGAAPNRGHALAAATFATLVFGALVAGLRAGVLYPTFPAFGGRWLPEEAFACGGSACLVDGAFAHWLHRMLAYGVAFAIAALLLPSVRAGGARRTWALRAYAHLALQVLLGALVVLSRVAAPLAVAHQLNAVALVLTLAALARREGMAPPRGARTRRVIVRRSSRSRAASGGCTPP